MQDAEILSTIEAEYPMYDARIMPKDLLTITVSTTDPEAAAPFNLIVRASTNSSNTTTFSQQATLQQYLVSNDGTITFPVLGTLTVGGLTKGEAESMICEKLGEYLKETPIVTVRMTNYKISVLGEVAAPGMCKDDFKIHLNKDGNLVIEMEKTNCGCKGKNEDKKECKYLRKEFSYSKFSQTLLLPDDIDKEGIEAHVCNGILKIRIKKTEKPLMEDQKKVIEVK